MRKKFLPLVLAALLCSCAQDGKVEVKRIADASYTVVMDSLLTSFPGGIAYLDGKVFWQDPFSTEEIMHVVDVERREEVAAFGKFGDAGDEFVMPKMSWYKDKFYLNDTEKNVGFSYEVKGDSVYRDPDQVAMESMATSFVRVNEQEGILFKPGDAAPFVYLSQGEAKSYGKQPIEGVTDGYNFFQGIVAYNPSVKKLVYSTFLFPYLAVYGVADGKLELLKELVTEQTKLDAEAEGAREMCTTKDYIVLVQRDLETEGEKPKPRFLRDLAVAPHSMFVYDYDLNLRAILHFDLPVVRVAGDVQSNDVYWVAADEEFRVLKTTIAL